MDLLVVVILTIPLTLAVDAWSYAKLRLTNKLEVY